MHPLICDRCGRTLLYDEDHRYVVRIEVFAAYDPLEVAGDDLKRDRRAELEELVEQMNAMSDEEIEEGIHKTFEFNLCTECQRRYIKDPLSISEQEDSDHGHDDH